MHLRLETKLSHRQKLTSHFDFAERLTSLGRTRTHTPGRLILYVHRDDRHARRLVSELQSPAYDITFLDNLASTLARAGLSTRPNLPFDLFLLAVAEGQEEALRHTIEQQYLRRRGVGTRGRRTFLVCGSPRLQQASSLWDAGNSPLLTVELSEFHERYKSLLHWRTNLSMERPPHIILFDSGVDSVQVRIDAEVDLLGNPSAITYHHGTVIALVLRNLLPASHITSYRVMDGRGVFDGWDLLAAFCSPMDADVVNVSSTLLDPDRNVRSVARNVIANCAMQPNAPIIVGATGNEGAPRIASPANFPEVVAISSITSRLRLSSFSNFGGKDLYGEHHPKYFTLPGGERRAEVTTEWVAYANGSRRTRVWGTSFAAAYASSIIAANCARSKRRRTTGAILGELQDRASLQDPDKQSYSLYGHGVLHFS